MSGLDPKAMRKGLEALRRMNPTDPVIHRLMYALAPTDPDDRAEHLVDMLAWDDDNPLPEDVAWALREDPDPKVRIAAWRYTVAPVEETRDMLATETAAGVRLLAIGQPGLSDDERIAIAGNMDVSTAASVLQFAESAPLSLVLDALAKIWPKLHRCGLPNKEAVTKALRTETVARAVVDNTTAPVEVRVRAAAALPVEEMLTALEALTVELADRDVELESKAYDYLWSAFVDVSSNPEMTADQADRLAAFTTVFTQAPPDWFAKMVDKFRLRPRKRIREFTVEQAEVYINTLTDTDDRNEAALGMLFRANLRPPADGRDMFDIFSPFLVDTSERYLLEQGADWDASPLAWMLRFPDLFVAAALLNPSRVTSISQLHSDDPAMVGIRSQFVQAYLACPWLEGSVVGSLLLNGWMTDADLPRVPLPVLLDAVTAKQELLRDAEVTGGAVSAILARFVADTAEETRTRMEALLTLASQCAPLADVAGATLAALDAVPA